MKEQLTPKHLSKHLPYELKCYSKGYVTEIDYKTPIIFDMIGLNLEWVDLNDDIEAGSGQHDYEDVLPILFPLEMLTQPIGILGETINLVDLDYNSSPASEFWACYRMTKTDKELGFNNSYRDMNNLEHGFIELLLKYHFDVDGLIEKGLAVPVTKDFNPYK